MKALQKRFFGVIGNIMVQPPLPSPDLSVTSDVAEPMFILD